MSDVKKTARIICSANLVLPQTVCMIFPSGLSYEFLEGLKEGDDKFLLTEGDENAFVSTDSQEWKDKVFLLCSVVEKAAFKDDSKRFVIRVESRVVVDKVTSTMTIGPKLAYSHSAEYREFKFPQIDSDTQDSLKSALMSSFREYCEYSKEMFSEKISLVKKANNIVAVCDLVASFLELDDEKKRKYLKLESINDLVSTVIGFIDTVMYKEKLTQEIKAKAKESIDKNQKHYYLSEQLKAIQKEISKLYGKEDSEDEELQGEEAALDEISTFKKKVAESGMPKEVADKCRAEIKKLSMQSPLSPESGVVRNYIETLLALPWTKKSELNKDLSSAEEVLEEEHYGLEKVKERILEYLAVQNRSDKLHSPIICLVGPPGVGKTSLGKSIAKATGRTYVRVALGGMHDEAEIRGHRRTYLGALPGKIVQKIIKSGVKNPLFLLDEIDKVSTDTLRGDPSSALLEVLDPEQNKTFADNYLEVDYDLSDVMFMATSNSMNIPPALLDRMEIINLSSYTEEEKMHIAKKHLLPKQFEANAVGKDEIKISDDAILSLIRNYTHEAGVRNLEREIGRLCRKGVKKIMLSKGKTKKVSITAKQLQEYIGPQIFDCTERQLDNRVGIVNGLAYTTVGGDVLTIEAVAVPGAGKQVFTGKLGDVMKESIAAAVTVVRARAEGYGITPDFAKAKDLHIHCPEGAVPKDGPSAGIAMCTAILSAISGIKVRGDVAMTGEITLRGEVLPIGGLREKLVAAQREGIKKVLIPHDNVKDLEEVPKNARDALEIVPVKYVEEVFKEALETLPVAKKKTKKKTTSTTEKNVVEKK